MQINIDYRFTSLNDYISAERANRYAAAKIKETETEIARLSALNKSNRTLVYPVDINCTWFRKDARTDPDNISFGIKFILDGFVKAGLLKGDNWKFIKHIGHGFEISNYDYVIVDID